MIDKNFEEINEVVLTRQIQVISNGKMNFVGIYTLSSDFYEENVSETPIHRCSIGKRVLKQFL